MNKKFEFNYSVYSNEMELPDAQKELLHQAKKCLEDAYAPYSKFHVGCAILLENKKIITGVNIENASYPVGICAERSALASAISQYPHQKILVIAISYNSNKVESNSPAFPCGMCRQFILECESRNEQDIPLVLAGMCGDIIVIDTIKYLLPFGFTDNDLQ